MVKQKEESIPSKSNPYLRTQKLVEYALDDNQAAQKIGGRKQITRLPMITTHTKLGKFGGGFFCHVVCRDK